MEGEVRTFLSCDLAGALSFAARARAVAAFAPWKGCQFCSAGCQRRGTGMIRVRRGGRLRCRCPFLLRWLGLLFVEGDAIKSVRLEQKMVS